MRIDDTVDVGAWVRVSAGGQDEANQVPEIITHCTSHDYRITKWYTLNDKSASKGEQQAKLDEAVTDMKLGIIKVIVCWHSDRMERRGPKHLFRLLRQVRDAGGRIESVKEPLFGATDLSGETLTALGAVIAHQYSVHLAEQVKIAHDRIKANQGLMPGGIPWGYVVTGPKYAKTIASTDECRKYAPQIFQRCIDGDSCRTIAIWLDSEGVKPKRGAQWNERSVWQIIHNMVYAGRRQDEGPTGNRKNRRTIMQCEAVVSMDVWRRANQALARRPGRGPGVNGTLQPKPLLVNLKCARCDSPMYRIRKYYRCFGKGTRRKGCGNMIPLEQLDTIVISRILAWKDKAYQIKTWKEGVSWDAEIGDVKQSLAGLAQEMPDDYQERHDQLMADLARYRRKNEHEATEGHWESFDTGMTIGEYFYLLSYDGKRDYLKTMDIRVEKAADNLGHIGVRLMIDDEDLGVFLYPPTSMLRAETRSGT
jgi:DNA invertase Pin-like site-specific DNA recombinase